MEFTKPITPEVVEIKEDYKYGLNVKYLLVILCGHFLAQHVEYPDVLSGQVLGCKEIDSLEKTESDVYLKELGFVDGAFNVDCKFINGFCELFLKLDGEVLIRVSNTSICNARILED